MTPPTTFWQARISSSSSSGGGNNIQARSLICGNTTRAFITAAAYSETRRCAAALWGQAGERVANNKHGL